MAFDALMQLRAASAGDMTATFTGSYVAIPPSKKELVVRLVVPSLAEANDKIVPTIYTSNDGTNAKETLTQADVTYANVVTNKITEYYYKIPSNRAYIKLVLTATDADSGSDFNAGAVACGVVPAGRYLAP